MGTVKIYTQADINAVLNYQRRKSYEETYKEAYEEGIELGEKEMADVIIRLKKGETEQALLDSIMVS